MLRGIASLMVCLYHFTGTLDNPFWHDEIGVYGKYGVQLFFVISGFVIPLSMYNVDYQFKFFPKFILKRTIRIEPVYFCAILLIIGISYLAKLSPYGVNGDLNFINTNTFLHLFYLVDFFDGHWLNDVFWTLAIEFQFYILIGLTFTFLQKSSSKITLLILLLACSLPFLIHIDYLISEYLLLFISGFLYYLFYIEKIKVQVLILFLAFIFVLNIIQFDIFNAFCPLIAISFFHFIKKTNNIFLFLGKISFSLYLLHTPIGTDGIINFSQNFILDETGRTILMFSTIPLVLFFSWLFYKVVEEPALKFSKKIVFNQKTKN